MWQTIESAPKDGWFDVWRDGVRFPDARRQGKHFAAATGEWKDGQPVVERLVPPPTHWMPLPAPPEEPAP